VVGPQAGLSLIRVRSGSGSTRPGDHDAVFPKFAQKSLRPRGYPPLRYGDAMRDATLLPYGSQPGYSTAHTVPPNPRLAPQPGQSRPRERRTLTRADWIGAALDALARDGLRAVAVEPLAERLGATKGSFYWHFRDRGALLEATVEHWETVGTDEVLGGLDEIADPAERHRAALAHAAQDSRDSRIFLALIWNADHAMIGPAVERILRKRMDFSLRLRTELGADVAEARSAMLHAYSVVLGLQLLRRAVPGMVPECSAPEDFMAYVGSLAQEAVSLAFPGLS
jgi:AcrR family transcriptional regulator